MTFKGLPAPDVGTEERSDEVPTPGAGAPAARRDPEVAAKPKRRQFTAEYRLRILEEADRCTEPGEVGQLLRREGLCSSHLTVWRKARRSGALLWAVANLWAFRERTRPGRELGLAGSLCIWSWDLYVVFGLVGGAVHRPFAIGLGTGWQVLSAVLPLGGGSLTVLGMSEFRSLARISALDETRLITTGIYAHVRHPQISGLVAVAFGLAIGFGTLVGILTAVVLLLWALIQTRLEDQRLVVLFGDEARDYLEGVPRYVPRLTTSYSATNR